MSKLNNLFLYNGELKTKEVKGLDIINNVIGKDLTNIIVQNYKSYLINAYNEEKANIEKEKTIQQKDSLEYKALEDKQIKSMLRLQKALINANELNFEVNAKMIDTLIEQKHILNETDKYEVQKFSVRFSEQVANQIKNAGIKDYIILLHTKNENIWLEVKDNQIDKKYTEVKDMVANTHKNDDKVTYREYGYKLQYIFIKK